MVLLGDFVSMYLAQNVLVMRFEADTQEKLNSIRSQVEERVQLAKSGQ